MMDYSQIVPPVLPLHNEGYSGRTGMEDFNEWDVWADDKKSHRGTTFFAELVQLTWKNIISSRDQMTSDAIIVRSRQLQLNEQCNFNESNESVHFPHKKNPIR